MAGPAFFISTMGCKINQYESHSLREAWTARGMAEAEAPEQAELILVNSCAVTARAVRDLRQRIRHFRRLVPKARIIAAGCAAQVLADELAAMPEVDAVVPQSAKSSLLDGPGLVRPDTFSRRSEDHAPARGFPAFSINGYDRSRPVLKVQDGCTHRCTYCIVPDTRGPAVSRPPDQSVAEARRLLEAGFREIMVSGINLRQYGRDLPGRPDFWDLLQTLERELAPEWAGRARFRLSSIDPGQLGPKALDTLGASLLACPHLHLSIQSFSPTVLGRMGRGHYGPEDVTRFLEGLGSAWPLFGLGADLLTGFPGETEEEFRETAQTFASLPFTYAHVFPYSRRPGTPATDMKGQVQHQDKKNRASELRLLAEDKRRNFALRQSGLDRLHVCVIGEAGQRGVSEFYTSCSLDPALPGRSGRLAWSAPTGTDNGELMVRPLSRADAGGCL